jgi:hypothetical protein
MTSIPQSPSQKSDFMEDVKSLFAQVIPSNFWNTDSPLALLLRMFAVGSAVYGLYRITDGILKDKPFFEYDIGFFFLLSILPLLLAASLAARR